MEINEAATIFTALAQETRLKVYRILVEHGHEGIYPNEIAAKLQIPRNTLSFHLSLLKQADLCKVTRKGKMLICKPNCAKIQEIRQFLHDDCIVCCDA
jgi:DNA-binding transcriptional ArsR family regulator